MNDISQRFLSYLRPRILFTVIVAGIAALVLWGLWRDYLFTPWTRDGRVNAEVVKVAPEVADNIISLPVVDNQPIHKGDIVARIDPARYKEILAQCEARVAGCKQALEERSLEARRRERLLQGNAVSVEAKQIADTALTEAQAAYDEAVATRNLARINLDRTIIRAPANGWIVNLHARVGDYATPGEPILTILDSDSFWIAAYIEETRLAHVRVGDLADIRLMGIGKGIEGHVESLSEGIQDENQANFTGLNSINPIFTWVRLAQRMPVRIHIDKIDPKIHIYAGETCSIYIKTRPGI